MWKGGLAMGIREELSAPELDRLPRTSGRTSLCLTFSVQGK